MQSINRRNTQLWLVMMSGAGLVFTAAGAIVPAVVTGGLTIGVLAMETLQDTRQQRQRRQRLQRTVNTTQAAQMAQSSAMHHPQFGAVHTLVDIGVMLDEYRREALVVRRVRSVSLSDRALRPYVVLHSSVRGDAVPTHIRFEILDVKQQPQFVYEVEHPIQRGENAIIPDYRLPLKDNQKLGHAGQWILNVWVAGYLVGAHSFTVYAATHETPASVDGEVKRADGVHEPMPLSLEDILGQQTGAPDA